MKRALSFFVSSALGIIAFLHSGNAHALGPVDIEAGGKIGVGTNPSDGPTPFGLGAGGRAGISFLGGIYAGVNAVYYFGGSADLAGVSVSTHSFLYGVEAGYGFKLLLLTIRPQLGLGNATFSASVGPLKSSDSHLYLEPGVTALVDLGLLYVGADANVLVIPGVDQGDGSSKTYGSFTLHGQVGVKF